LTVLEAPGDGDTSSSSSIAESASLDRSPLATESTVAPDSVEDRAALRARATTRPTMAPPKSAAGQRSFLLCKTSHHGARAGCAPRLSGVVVVMGVDGAFRGISLTSPVDFSGSANPLPAPATGGVGAPLCVASK